MDISLLNITCSESCQNGLKSALDRVAILESQLNLEEQKFSGQISDLDAKLDSFLISSSQETCPSNERTQPAMKLDAVDTRIRQLAEETGQYIPDAILKLVDDRAQHLIENAAKNTASAFSIFPNL